MLTSRLIQTKKGPLLLCASDFDSSGAAINYFQGPSAYQQTAIDYRPAEIYRDSSVGTSLNQGRTSIWTSLQRMVPLLYLNQR